MPSDRSSYLKLCMSLPLGWLERSVADPGPYMKPRYIQLQRLAIRKLRQRGY